jgi:hypothetical protein
MPKNTIILTLESPNFSIKKLPKKWCLADGLVFLEGVPYFQLSRRILSLIANAGTTFINPQTIPCDHFCIP